MMNDELKDKWSYFIIHHSYFIISLSCFRRLRHFRDFVAFDATGANLHAHHPALRALRAYLLQVGIETPAGAIVRVRDVVTELWAFAADFASFSHNCFVNLRIVESAPRESPELTQVRT
jgi:hypothetical protein